MPLSKEALGKLIKKARKIKEKKIGSTFTQKDLAKQVGKSRSYIGDIELGRTYPSYSLLSSIANACDVPLSFFSTSKESVKIIVDDLCGDFSDEEKEEFIEYVLKNISDEFPASESFISVLKQHFILENNEYIRAQHNQHIEDTMNAEQEYMLDNIRFTNPQDAIKFILSQPTIMGFGGFDINKMSDEDVMDFANDLLHHLELLSYKYKK